MKHFIIDNTNFTIDNIQTDTFDINSIPRNYNVSFKKFDINFTDNDFLLIDRNIYHLYGIKHSQMILIDATEQNKTIETVLSVCDWLTSKKFNKGNHLYVVGGGITQDIGAFVGSIYKRGINWTFIPTTLLAQCDSCIGGKTALNFDHIKNHLALFSAPHSVIIDTDFLNSLPEQEILSGMGEIVKFFIIGGLNYLNLLDTNIKNKIYQGLLIKKTIIEYDEFEKNIRKSLNYGHSFGHAIEAASDYKISHGESVLLGIEVINQLFYKSPIITNTINKYTSIDKIKHLKTKDIISLLKHDKKSQLNKITLVVVNEPGITSFIPTDINNELEKKLYEIFTN